MSQGQGGKVPKRDSKSGIRVTMRKRLPIIPIKRKMENHTHNVEQFPLIIKVRVTRQDLKNPYSSPNRCPIATALKRAFPHLAIMVGGRSVDMWDPNYKGGRSFPVYEYSLRREDTRKAMDRGDNSLWGKIIGGFDVVLVRR